MSIGASPVDVFPNLNTVRKIVKVLMELGSLRPEQRKQGRSHAIRELKRTLILDSAREVFEAEGLDGTSLRAIAAKAGYTPAALYFHFESKEAIYAEVLQDSLQMLSRTVSQRSPALGIRKSACARPPWRSSVSTLQIRAISTWASICFAAG